MTLPTMLDHDTTAYDDVLGRILAISQTWNTTRMPAQLMPLTEIWTELPGDPAYALPRSMVAHLIADLQNDPHEEMRWDLESLRCLTPAWEQTHDPRLFDAAGRCLPSIYYSLAGASRRCGNLTAAHEYIRRFHLLAQVLQPSEYTNRLIAAAKRLERDLDAR